MRRNVRNVEFTAHQSWGLRDLHRPERDDAGGWEHGRGIRGDARVSEHEVRSLISQVEVIRQNHLAAHTLRQGLTLFGIAAPERM